MAMAPSESSLRQLAREAIEDGRLPVTQPAGMWGGRGTGVRCIMCGEAIEPHETEFEIQFGSQDLGEGNPRLHMHCFAAWEFERGRAAVHGQSNAEPFGASAANSTLNGDEGSNLPAIEPGGKMVPCERTRKPQLGSA